MSVNPTLLYSVITASLLCSVAVEAENFSDWLWGVRAEAAASGVESKTLDVALDEVTFDSRVVELQLRQPESQLTLAEYLESRISPARVSRLQEELAAHEPLLSEISAKYKVQPRFIIALWALESDFGSNRGSWSTIRSLASLGYGGRRRDYFRRELIEALRLVDRMPEPFFMTGSWAGAVGQCQFMPSNVLRLGVDFDNDERKDVWDSLPDVFASIANFLSRSGWNDDHTWGREATLPANFDITLAGHEVRMRLPRWGQLGVRRADGGPLPTRELWTSLLLPDGIDGKAYLVYENFRVLRRWNKSDHFGLSVGLLSDTAR